MNNNFEIYDEDGNLVTQISVFDDGSYWVGTDGEHTVAISELHVEDDDEEENDIVDATLDWLDKHNRDTGG